MGMSQRNDVQFETKIRILELHQSGRSIASLMREFGFARSTILRVLAKRDELERSARCAEMFAHGVDPYFVAEYRQSGGNLLKKAALPDSEAKRFFERLITVSAVGPELAVEFLSRLSVQRAVQAIREQDYAQLECIPGVGKTLAERVILELKDKLDDFAVPRPQPSGQRPA